MGCIPKKFLCRFSLDLGALVVGVVMLVELAYAMFASTALPATPARARRSVVKVVRDLCILILCGIVMIFQMIYIRNCDSCSLFAWRNCYAYSITGFVYILIMIAANLWFFNGIQKKKSSVVLCWIVVSLMWLSLIFVLLITLICLYFSDGYSITSEILTLIFGLVAIALLFYGLMVIVGFWLELKQSKPPPETA